MFAWISVLMGFPLVLFISAAVGVYGYLLYINSYWKRHGVPFVSATPLLGNMSQVCLFRRSVAENINDMYVELPEEPIVGIHLFTNPALIIRNLDLIKAIVVKDFAAFQNRYALWPFTVGK